jgi:HAD superfamily hydrolase (TIGR01549 family)
LNLFSQGETMPRAIIFDVDGTLLDSVDLHAKAWQEAFAQYGKNVSFPEVRRQIGKGADQLMPVFLSEKEIARFGKELTDYRSQYFQEYFLDIVRPFPQVRQLFQRIAASGQRIAIASSATEDELEEYKRIAHVGDLLDSDTSSKDVERSKPHPDIFEAALEKLGMESREVLVVGDTPYDAEASLKAGLRIVGVLCGGFPEATLRKAGCCAIYRDPAHLLAEYDRSPLGYA